MRRAQEGFVFGIFRMSLVFWGFLEGVSFMTVFGECCASLPPCVGTGTPFLIAGTKKLIFRMASAIDNFIFYYYETETLEAQAAAV